MWCTTIQPGSGGDRWVGSYFRFWIFSLVEVDVFVCLFLGEVGGQVSGIADAREKQGEHYCSLYAMVLNF